MHYNRIIKTASGCLAAAAITLASLMTGSVTAQLTLLPQLPHPMKPPAPENTQIIHLHRLIPESVFQSQ